MKGLNQYIVETLSDSSKEELLDRFKWIINQSQLSDTKDLDYINKHILRLENMLSVGDFIKSKGLEKVTDTKNAINNIYSKEKNLNNIFNQLTGEKLKNRLNNLSSLSLFKVFPNLKEYSEIFKELNTIFYDAQQSSKLTVGDGEYFLRCMLSDIDTNKINNSVCDIYCESAKFEVKYLRVGYSSSTAAIFGGKSAFEDTKKEKDEEKKEELERKNKNLKTNKLNFSCSKLLNCDIYGFLDKNDTEIQEKVEELWNLVMKKFKGYINGTEENEDGKKSEKDGIILFIDNGGNISNINMIYLKNDMTIDEIKQIMRDNNLIFNKFASKIEVRANNKEFKP